MKNTFNFAEQLFNVLHNNLDQEELDMNTKNTDCDAYKIGYSEDVRHVWYNVKFVTPKKATDFNELSRVYLDIDNKTLFLTDLNSVNTMITYSPNDSFVIEKFEQIDKKFITGFETATVEQLSSGDYEPVPIWEFSKGTPTIIPLNLAVNDRDGYSIIRNTR